MCPREDRFIIRMYDCRPDGSIKVNALMQYLQEAAACHAEQLRAGFRDLDRLGCLWVLVNLRIEIARTPRWGDHMIVGTWPSGHTRVVASREFIGRDPDGAEFFRASSDWMILDKSGSRPKNLDRIDLDLPRSGPRAIASPPARLKPADEYARVCMFRVPFSALDFNGHVNNTEYVRWALDAIHQKLGGLPEIRLLQLTYMAEIFEGDEIELLVSTGRDGGVCACARKAGGANAFLMEILC